MESFLCIILLIGAVAFLGVSLIVASQDTKPEDPLDEILLVYTFKKARAFGKISSSVKQSTGSYFSNLWNKSKDSNNETF